MPSEGHYRGHGFTRPYRPPSPERNDYAGINDDLDLLAGPPHATLRDALLKVVALYPDPYGAWLLRNACPYPADRVVKYRVGDDNGVSTPLLLGPACAWVTHRMRFESAFQVLYTGADTGLGAYVALCAAETVQNVHMVLPGPRVCAYNARMREEEPTSEELAAEAVLTEEILAGWHDFEAKLPLTIDTTGWTGHEDIARRLDQLKPRLWIHDHHNDQLTTEDLANLVEDMPDGTRFLGIVEGEKSLDALETRIVPLYVLHRGGGRYEDKRPDRWMCSTEPIIRAYTKGPTRARAEEVKARG